MSEALPAGTLVGPCMSQQWPECTAPLTASHNDGQFNELGALRLSVEHIS